jgi:hypothetical protein
VSQQLLQVASVLEEKNFADLLNRDLEPAKASELVGLLDKLIDLIPDAGTLRRLRNAALLAT